MNTENLHPCPGCRSPLRVDGYHALLRKDEKGSFPEDGLEPHPAECFFHPGKKAIAPCDSCGRLLCRLCQVELNGQNICMNCLKVGREKQKISTLQNSQVLYDNLALALATWPLLIFFLTLVTAPAAVFFAVRHFRSPALVLPKKRLKGIFACILATGQIIGWVTFFVTRFA
ncbi:MAG: hypothetical protein FP816_19195 [Desulfobacteraceae bacterium]|nr:hypothetical protein [Desulfobacteraceae bacterium]